MNNDIKIGLFFGLDAGIVALATFGFGPDFAIGMLAVVTAIGVAVLKKSEKNAEKGVQSKDVILPKVVAPFQKVETFIAGNRYNNSDGTSRKEFLKSCHNFQRLLLIPEPNNPVDSNAIKICTESNNQLGYVPRNVARIIAPLIVSGKRFACIITNKDGKPTAMDFLEGKVPVNTNPYCSISIWGLEYDK